MRNRLLAKADLRKCVTPSMKLSVATQMRKIQHYLTLSWLLWLRKLISSRKVEIFQVELYHEKTLIFIIEERNSVFPLFSP